MYPVTFDAIDKKTQKREGRPERFLKVTNYNGHVGKLLAKCWVCVTQCSLFSSYMNAEDTKECKAPVKERNGVGHQQTLVRHAKYCYENAGSRVGGPYDRKERNQITNQPAEFFRQ